MNHRQIVSARCKRSFCQKCVFGYLFPKWPSSSRMVSPFDSPAPYLNSRLALRLDNTEDPLCVTSPVSLKSDRRDGDVIQIERQRGEASDRDVLIRTYTHRHLACIFMRDLFRLGAPKTLTVVRTLPAALQRLQRCPNGQSVSLRSKPANL